MKKLQFKGTGKKIDLNGQTLTFSNTVGGSGFPTGPMGLIAMCFPKIKANNITISVSYLGTRTGSATAYWGFQVNGGVSEQSQTITYGNPSTKRSVSKVINNGRELEGVQFRCMDIYIYSITIAFTDVEMVDE